MVIVVKYRTRLSVGRQIVGILARSFSRVVIVGVLALSASRYIVCILVRLLSI